MCSPNQGCGLEVSKSHGIRNFRDFAAEDGDLCWQVLLIYQSQPDATGLVEQLFRNFAQRHVQCELQKGLKEIDIESGKNRTIRR